MITLTKFQFYYMITLIIFLLIYFIYTRFLFKKARIDKRSYERFKKICKMEYRDPIDQEKLIIDQFIEKYSKEHNIVWNDAKREWDIETQSWIPTEE